MEGSKEVWAGRDWTAELEGIDTGMIPGGRDAAEGRVCAEIDGGTRGAEGIFGASRTGEAPKLEGGLEEGGGKGGGKGRGGVTKTGRGAVTGMVLREGREAGGMGGRDAESAMMVRQILTEIACEPFCSPTTSSRALPHRTRKAS